MYFHLFFAGAVIKRWPGISRLAAFYAVNAARAEMN